MNDLSSIKISPVYDSNDDIEGFYNETLSIAKSYKRVSAYFDSKLFSYISKGILGLIKNNGNMQLILSTEVTPEIYLEIRQGYFNRANEQLKKISDFAELSDIEDKVKNLSFLIEVGKLDIKIAFKEVGILHEKYGLIEDFLGNKVLFSGSNNETKAALESNYESFETTVSWDSSIFSSEKIKKREASFQKLWSNLEPKLIVIDGSDLVNDEIKKQFSEINIPKLSNVRIVYIEEVNGSIHIKLNFDGNILKSNIHFKLIKGYLKNYENQVYKFDVPEFIDDLVKIINIFENNQFTLDYKVFLSKTIKNYIDERYIDFNKLTVIGNQIKKPEFLSSEIFKRFFNELNSTLNRNLREAQALSAYHIINLQKVMNFSVPGSGKTASILAAYQYLKRENKIDRIVVVGPINCFNSWKSEYLKVIKNSREYDILDLRESGGKLDKDFSLKFDFNKSNLILINFESINQVDFKLRDLIDSSSLVVFDEVHRIKNPQGKRYISCRNIVKNARYIVSLTGTPLPNGYKDLHNLFEILYGEYSKTYFHFTIDSLNFINEKYIDSGLENKEVSNLMFPFYTRVTKKDLGIKAPIVDELIYINPTFKEQRKYDDILNMKGINSLKRIITLQKISCIPELINCNSNTSIMFGDNEDDIIYDFSKETTSKIDKCISLIKEIINKGESVIIWAIFISTIEKLSYFLRNEGIDFECIHGSVESTNRDDIIEKFNNGKLKIIITNPHTLAESVSLHYSCHNAIYLELNFNLSQYLQSRDRIHRLGISDNIETKYYILLNKYESRSIDEKIYKSLKKKEDLMMHSIDKGNLINNFEFSINEVEMILEEK